MDLLKKSLPLFLLLNNMKSIIPIVVILLLTIACADNTITGTSLLSAMKDTDSVEVIFFKSPGSTRYFTYTATTDETFIASLVSDVSGAVQPEQNCAKEGKLYCFSNGQIINTIYFVAENVQCRHMRYIRNGRLYFFPLSKQVAGQLAYYKSIAREPVGPDSDRR